MSNLGDILKRFEDRKILVIGDLMIDEYIEGSVNRLSSEAPVPIVKLSNRYFDIGGAGNVASNISTLGGKATLFSFIGDDFYGQKLKDLTSKLNIDCIFGLTCETMVKSRVIGNGQQIVRFDLENTDEKHFSPEIKDMLWSKANESDSIIISDYAKGTITEEVFDLLKDFSSKVILNPKPKNKSIYKNFSLMIPNEKEAREITGINDIYNCGHNIKDQYSCDVLITRGNKGMTLFTSQQLEIPTCAKEVYDVQGASDTVIATVSLAMASGSSLEEAAILGNQAAGIAVGRKGTYSVRLNELRQKALIGDRKIVSYEELIEITKHHREENKKIVWTNGCFDVFHPGHKYSIDKAKEKGDILIVGLDSDESVRKLKGPSRPIYNQEQRAEILSSLETVNYVLIFQPGKVAEYLGTLKPDVYVKSGNYTLENINLQEREVVEGYGGEIYLPKGLAGFSTTLILDKIKNNH